MITKSPDETICLWWDWKQPNGKLIRICFVNRYHLGESYCWESPRFAFSREQIQFIGGIFRAVPLEDF